MVGNWYRRIPIEPYNDLLNIIYEWQIPATFHYAQSQNGILHTTQFFEQVIFGKNLRLKQAFGVTQGGDAIHLRGLIDHAIRSNSAELFRYLWCGPQFAALWSTDDLNYLVDLLIQFRDAHWFNEFSLLNILLNESETAKQLFCQLPSTLLRFELISKIHSKFPTHSPSVLSKPLYAPYLLVHLVDKQAFIAAKGNHSVFSECLENTGSYELEELSKIGWIEERFVKFLKHIEILA